MAKKKIKDMVAELLCDYMKEQGYELYNIEFLKESKDWFLRVYIDKAHGGENDYVGTEDCEKVSRWLSEKLDSEDLIEQNYYLEVSSPGMDRELIIPKHFEKFAGRKVIAKLYKGIDGAKEITGILIGLKDGTILIEDENNEIIELARDQVAKINLAVIF